MASRSTSDLFGWEIPEADIQTLPPAGRLILHEGFLNADRATELMQELLVSLSFEQRPIRMFGRQVLQPRLTAFHGDAGIAYRYSGQTMEAQPWGSVLAAIRDRLQPLCGLRFNSVLCNFYRDGRDSMGWHADDEPELGQNPVIASVSLGAWRRFMLKSRAEGQRLEYSLGNGSLLIMAGDCQHHWVHQVPRTARPVGERMNLTFRTVFHHPADRQPPDR